MYKSENIQYKYAQKLGAGCIGWSVAELFDT